MSVPLRNHTGRNNQDAQVGYVSKYQPLYPFAACPKRAVILPAIPVVVRVGAAIADTMGDLRVRKSGLAQRFEVRAVLFVRSHDRRVPRIPGGAVASAPAEYQPVILEDVAVSVVFDVRHSLFLASMSSLMMMEQNTTMLAPTAHRNG